MCVMGVSTIRRVFVCERLFEMEPYHLKKDGTVLHSDWLGVDFSLPVYQYKDTGVYFVRTEEQALLDIIDEYYEEIFDCERPDFYEEDILEIVEGEPWWYPEGQHIVSTGYSMEEVKKIFPLIKEHFMCANYESGYDDFADGGYFYEKAEQAMSYDREYSYGEESIWHAAGYRADAKTDEVLGIHMIGARTADLIAEAVTAMEFRASAEDISRMSHAHPTFAEAIKEAALAATDNRALHV